jgi:hypothetical protein
MPNPWDIPPFPDHGDPVDDHTYAGVGRVLSQWEVIEIEISGIYAAFTGRYHSVAVRHEYGAGLIFTLRADLTKKAAQKFFIKKPNQNLEACFDLLMNEVENFSDRRNEVAHGIVRPLQFIRLLNVGDRLGLQFFLIPPIYTKRKFDISNIPKYIYTSKELLNFESALVVLASRLTRFRTSLNLLRRQ